MSRTTVLERLGVPIVQAPLAGGASTVELAAAVCDAGGLGFLAAGYRAAADVEREIAELAGRTRAPFGVNVFVPAAAPSRPEAYRAHLDAIRPVAERLGAELAEPRFDDDGWDAKLALLERAGVAVVSFTFGCPDAGVVDGLHAAGSEVWVTVTSPREACAAARAGADGVVAQGWEAGGHRGSFDDPDGEDPLGTLALVQLLVAGTALPVVAAGGIVTGAGVAAAVVAGATAAQLGTAFLRCPEAGTAPAHRAALGLGRDTRVTRAFTGRRARGIRNAFIERFDAGAPGGYPEIHHATAPLRAAARAAGDAEHLHLWAGQAHALAPEEPAGQLVGRLAREAASAVDRARSRLHGATEVSP